MTVHIIQGDAAKSLKALADDSIECCVTSPPYWGLRDYGIDGQLGLEQSPDEYVAKMVEVFAEVRRVLRNDGTLWLNLGDSYNAGRDGGHPGGSKQWKPNEVKYQGRSGANAPGLKHKDLVGVPWRVAFALQADGWYLRSDIIWHKPNPMPESVTDRPTKSHEYVFLMTRSEKYFYDAEAVREADQRSDPPRKASTRPERSGAVFPPHRGLRSATGRNGRGRNRRSVWTIPVASGRGRHFATFPPALVEICVLAGCPQGGTVLDPFAGSGTVGEVAEGLERSSVLIELNPEYVSMIKRRCWRGGR